jgi:hypothetical protein
MNDDVTVHPEVHRVARTASGLQHRNKLVLSRGEFPFVLFFPGDATLQSADRFTLESADGSYRHSLTVAEARRGRYGHLVLWFPMPPAGGKFSMRVDPADGGPHARAYYIFRDQSATYFSGAGS